MRTRKVGLFVLVATMGAALLIPSAGAAPPDPKSEHDRTVEFWTHARVAKAKPRDFVYDPATGRFVPSERAKGGRPGGGSGTGTVTGASWTKGGLVKETTGKVLFALGSSYYVCSASVATDPALNGTGRAAILTAAHCAYDETADAFASRWTFIPDYDEAPAPVSTSNASYCNDTAYGCWTASRLIVHTGYAGEESFTNNAVKHDFAFAVVGPGGKSGTADLDVAVGGAQAIAFDAAITTTPAHAFGYPAAQKYKGNDLVYCAGPVGTDPNTGGATYSIACDMTGGSSGGPWLTTLDSGGRGTLESVNSYGYSGVSNMYGPKLNANAQALYTEAGTSTAGNKVVG